MKYLLLLLFFCAKTLATPRYTVIGGHDAEPGQFPFIVSIQLCDYGPCLHDCGGVILSPSWILTGAHCARDMDLFEYQVYAGLTNLSDENKQIRLVENHILHPKFNEFADISAYDIAVVKLSAPLVLNDLVKVALLPTENDDVSEEPATLTGWGIYEIDYPEYTDILQTADVPIFPFEECMDIVSSESSFEVPDYGNTGVCTGPISGEIAACYGDSGGPLTQNGTLIGLVSWGSLPCANNGSLTVYTKVSPFISWIFDNIDKS